MFYTMVEGLEGHIRHQQRKSMLLFILMGCLFWGMPQILPSVLQFFWKRPLNSDEVALISFDHWWIVCLVLYVVMWVILELAASVLAAIGEESSGKHPRIEASLLRLSKRAGIRPPALVVVETEKANAAALGGIFARGTVLMFSKIIDILNADEEDVIMAHEVAHIKHLDNAMTALIRVGLIAFRYQRILLLLWIAAYLVVGTWEQVQLLLAAFAVVYAVNFAYSLMAAAFSRCREYLADAGAIALCGWTMRDELATAFYKVTLYHDKRMNIFRFLRGTGWEIFQTHPDSAKRIEALKVTTHFNERTGRVVFREQG